MSHHLLRICAVDRSSHSLPNDYQHLAQSHRKSLSSRAEVASCRLGRHRASGALAAPFHPCRRSRGSHSLHDLGRKHTDMASQQHIRQRSSTTDRTPLAESVIAARATVTTLAKSPEHLPRAHLRQNGRMDQALQSCADGRGGSGGGGRDPTSCTPPLYRDAGSSGGHSRAVSSTSRKNRLSLTLPIALANSDVARVAQSPAAPASTVSTSIPPTPLETSNGGDPHTASDFIIAIAAQERRVFELREELARAETELAQLKKQWTAEEVYRKKSDSQRTDPYRTVAAADDDVFVATKRSIELDRRKLLIQTQQGSQTPSNRKVLRGSHARTLSLLSPSKGEGGFSIGDESRTESILSPSMEQRAAQIANPHVTKRQSWQARPQHSQQASSSGISSLPQMVEDFRDGFRAFVEDIKQITIGDEPVTGPTSGSGSGSGSGNEQRPTAKGADHQRGNCVNKDQSGEPTFASPTRAAPARPKPIGTVDGTSSNSNGSSTGGLSAAAQLSKTPESKPRAGGKAKHFSWTPLGVDSFDDTDWTNWDSPESTKSARWSGSTLNGHGLDEIQSVCEDGEGNVFDGPPKKPSASEDIVLSPTFGEALPNAIDRFSPGNLKRAADNFMGEWERSLMPPEDQGKVDCP